ncbi:hypothetical protein H2200_010863 [Cladophialophora chaetospira]|uniref:Uncharacterized protein n=1 Tax=Cladophialophora chaetospira TaxID=386627 RepID=A0AA38X0W8_9EURO|nr:hypothetical protein H2200_010863 [Cladophialophora chaetospira]
MKYAMAEQDAFKGKLRFVRLLRTLCGEQAREATQDPDHDSVHDEGAYNATNEAGADYVLRSAKRLEEDLGSSLLPSRQTLLSDTLWLVAYLILGNENLTRLGTDFSALIAGLSGEGLLHNAPDGQQTVGCWPSTMQRETSDMPTPTLSLTPERESDVKKLLDMRDLPTSNLLEDSVLAHPAPFVDLAGTLKMLFTEGGQGYIITRRTDLATLECLQALLYFVASLPQSTYEL